MKLDTITRLGWLGYAWAFGYRCALPKGDFGPWWYWVITITSITVAFVGQEIQYQRNRSKSTKPESRKEGVANDPERG